MENAEFLTGLTFSLLVKESDSEAVEAGLVAVTDGKITSLLEEELFFPWEEDPMEVSPDGSV